MNYERVHRVGFLFGQLRSVLNHGSILTRILQTFYKTSRIQSPFFIVLYTSRSTVQTCIRQEPCCEYCDENCELLEQECLTTSGLSRKDVLYHKPFLITVPF